MNKKKQLNEFLQSEIKQKLSAVKKITWITAITDKKIISIFCVSGILYSPPHTCCSKQMVSLTWLYFLLESTTEEKKS